MRNCFYVVLIFSLILAGAFTQAQSDQDNRIEQLEKICKQQEEQIQKLQTRLTNLDSQENYKEYTQKIVKEYMKEPHAQENTGIVAGYENGFFVRSADGDYELVLTGLIQMGLGIFENKSFDNNSFYPNGVYVNFDFHYKKKVHARIEVDFADPTAYPFQGSGLRVTLRDAYLEYLAVPEFNVRVGNTHVPFTMQGQYAPNEGITIFAPPFINSWSHGRDPGIMLYGTFNNMIEYRVGVHNGEFSNQTNQDDDFLVAGQLRVYFLGKDKNANTYLHIGGMRNRITTTPGANGRAGLVAPWGRPIFDGADNNPHDKYDVGGVNPDPEIEALRQEEDTVRGWATGGYAGLRFQKELDNGGEFRVDSDFMYMSWERNLKDPADPTVGRLPYLHGWGTSFATSYRHPIMKDIKGSGIIPAFAFSYSQIDNKKTDHPGDIRGQRVYTYTAGLGYSFNAHFNVTFNWVIMNVDNKDTNPPKNRLDGSGSLEQAWFLQFGVAW